MLNVCGLTKQYGKKIAIQDISFHINPGEIVGLVGHNGCGKSTTMNIITGYLAADRGTVTVDHEDYQKNQQSARKKIGFLSEVPALYLDMTVEEQLSFVCELKKIPQKKDAIQKACRRTEITGVRNRLIRNLSKGYKQRIGLAQAFLGEPPLLILDEPSSGLDPSQSAEMRDMICEAGKTHAILLSSHVLDEIAAICSRIVILSNGHLAADDTLGGLRRKFSVPGLYQVKALGNADRFFTMAYEETRVREIKPLPCEEEGCFCVSFFTDETDAAMVIASLLSKAECIMMEFGPVTPHLQQIFSELTCDRRYETEDQKR